MIRSIMKLLTGLIILTGFQSFEGFEGLLFAQMKEKSKLEARKPGTYERIQRAADMGELTLKEAVLLKAKLLFVPTQIPKDSKYAPKPGEGKTQGEGLTGFYKEVHSVFPELNEQEKKFLKSLSPDLEAIITQREKEQRGTRK